MTKREINADTDSSAEDRLTKSRSRLAFEATSLQLVEGEKELLVRTQTTTFAIRRESQGVAVNIIV